MSSILSGALIVFGRRALIYPAFVGYVRFGELPVIADCARLFYWVLPSYGESDNPSPTAKGFQAPRQ